MQTNNWFWREERDFGTQRQNWPNSNVKPGALATHNEIGSILAAEGGHCQDYWWSFAKAGIDVDAPGT